MRAPKERRAAAAGSDVAERSYTPALPFVERVLYNCPIDIHVVADARMKFLIKLFPEITIKSPPVRKRMIKQLRKNIRTVLRRIDPAVEVEGVWDKIEVECGQDPVIERQVTEALGRIPGITTYQEVLSYPLADLDDMFARALELYREPLAGKTFCVRCRRAGKHAFSSLEVERYIGGGLNQHTEAAGVKLKDPDMTVHIEVRDNRYYLLRNRYQGLGGYPLNTQEPVLSLISGGFDSTVSSFMTMKRGVKTHFVFFNLGGYAHEVGVKEVAYYLWDRYGSSQRVKFVSIPFEGVVAEILEQVENSQMGVILKRMMMRAASRVAEEMEIDALVTGEAIAQVSSQTLPNLALIDEASDVLVLRPLITTDKQAIIDTATAIGTADFAKNIPEYCGVISKKPTTRAKRHKIEAEEERFDFAVLEQAIAERTVYAIQDLAANADPEMKVEILTEVPNDAIVLDIRHPDEVDERPLELETPVLEIPFFRLNSAFAEGELEKGKCYLLYCDKGVMSQLHAQHLRHEGLARVAVFRPEDACSLCRS